MEYKLALQALDATRRRVVQQNEVEQARELIRWACKIARAEVNTPVTTSEVWLWQHYTGEATAAFHAAQWAAIDEWADSLEDPVGFLADTSYLASWDRWDYLQDHVTGLGPTKAAMACALMGDPIGCIDIHGAAEFAGVPTCLRSTDGSRTVANPAARQAYKELTKRKNYIASCEKIWPRSRNHRNTQWANFWRMKDEGTKGTPGASFRKSAHMPFFTVLLEVTGEVV